MTAPLAYLTSAGERARAIVPLTWFTLFVSLTVCVVIGILLWMAASRAHGNGGAGETRAIPVESGNNGLLWITTGLWISAVPLAITLVWTMVTLAAVSGPPTNPGLVLDVTGHQWWWEVTYVAQDPSQTFVTANEIHIPVGMRVLVRLHGGDVIHSFWVPQLSGKTDTIPGQTNLAWLQADQPGRYRGQCSEYCGRSTRTWGSKWWLRAPHPSRTGARVSYSRPQIRRKQTFSTAAHWWNIAVGFAIRYTEPAPEPAALRT